MSCVCGGFRYYVPSDDALDNLPGQSARLPRITQAGRSLWQLFSAGLSHGDGQRVRGISNRGRELRDLGPLSREGFEFGIRLPRGLGRKAHLLALAHHPRYRPSVARFFPLEEQQHRNHGSQASIAYPICDQIVHDLGIQLAIVSPDEEFSPFS